MNSVWPFTGRTGELARIRDSLRDQSGPRAIVIGGPAGIGKSRLIAEVLAGVDAGRWKVIEVRAGQAPSARFGGVAHLLPDHARLEEPDRVARLLADGDREVLVVADDEHALDEPTRQVVEELLRLDAVRLLVADSADPTFPGLDHLVLRLAPLGAAEIASLLERVLGGPVEAATADRLHRAAAGDLDLLQALLRAGRSTGTLSDGSGAWRWEGEAVVSDPLRRLLEGRELPGPEEELGPSGPVGLEVALAAHSVLSGTSAPTGHLWAKGVLAQAAVPEEERARAVYTVARAAGLAWGLDRADAADRLLAETLAGLREPGARQRVMIQRAAGDLHRARSREALDGAADARALTDPDPVAAAGIAMVEALAAALTGQTAAAIHTADRALEKAAEWAVAAPEHLPSLEFARSSAWLVTGDLDAAEEHLEFGDPVAYAAVRTSVLRQRGRLREALWQGWDGARRLRFTDSLFAGPCLGEVAQAAVLVGDLPVARAALAEAERRAIPALRALWFPVALARPWVLAAQGAVGAAVHDLLDVAAAAEELELRAYALVALHDVVRLGAAGVVADRLLRLADEVDGELPALYARHAVAAAAGDAAGLSAVSEALEGLGMPVFAAEALAQAAEAHWDKRQAAAAGSRAWVLAQRADRVRTPALGSAAQPDLTLIQYEIAELAAQGRTDPEIAERLGLHARTVGEQLKVVRGRLGAAGQDDLVTLFGP